MRDLPGRRENRVLNSILNAPWTGCVLRQCFADRTNDLIIAGPTSLARLLRWRPLSARHGWVPLGFASDLGRLMNAALVRPHRWGWLACTHGDRVAVIDEHHEPAASLTFAQLEEAASMFAGETSHCVRNTHFKALQPRPLVRDPSASP